MALTGHLLVHLACPSRALALIVEVAKSNANMRATLLYVGNASVLAWRICARGKQQYCKRCQSSLKRPHQVIADLHRQQEIGEINQKHRVRFQISKCCYLCRTLICCRCHCRHREKFVGHWRSPCVGTHPWRTLIHGKLYGVSTAILPELSSQRSWTTRILGFSSQ